MRQSLTAVILISIIIVFITLMILKNKNKPDITISPIEETQ